MAPSHVSLPIRSNAAAGGSSKAARAASKDPAQPVEAFDEVTLRDFELWLSAEKGRLALDAHRRAHLRRILDPDYRPSRQDILGKDKTSKEIKRENTEKWKARRVFDLNEKNQIVRRPEGEFGTRIAACTWDASKYIVDRHRELLHAGGKKTFTSLKQQVWGL